MTLGEKVRKARLEKGKSLNELAEKCGCAKSSILRWERDVSEPSFFNVIVLSQVLGLSLDYLAGLEE